MVQSPIMMVELAIGDAYGSTFEFAGRDFVSSENDVSGYVLGRGREPGRYTDDTQMSLAVAEAILSGEDLCKELFARKFVECYKRDPRPGYARSFRRLLEEVKDGDELLSRIRPKSDRSGAAMRAMPIGVLPDLDLVKEASIVQASVTHDSPDGIRSSMASALMTHYFLYEVGPRRELAPWMESQVPGEWSVPWTDMVGTKGIQCVRAAITAIMSRSGLSSILRRSIAFSGDVDTVAAISMATASSSIEVRKDLPKALFSGLENGTYGRDYLAEINEKLLYLCLDGHG